MSADNWTSCPKCYGNFNSKIGSAKYTVDTQYGEVSQEEYHAAVELSKKTAEELTGQTLREDYDFFMDREGVFSASYSCRCKRCGFSFSFKEEQMLRLSEYLGKSDEWK